MSALTAGQGVQITGFASGVGAGRAVAGLGDINGDGFDDFAIGVPLADPNGLTNAGSVHVLYGGGHIDDATSYSIGGMQDFAIHGVYSGGSFGFSIAGGGDVNGDGFRDFLIGAPNDDGASTDGGAAYLVYGGNFNGAVTRAGSSGNDSIAGDGAIDNFIGGLGDDILTGNGGADALTGGAGNDLLTVIGTDFRRADGGAGVDKLDLLGISANLNLGLGNVRGVEQVGLNSGGRQLTLTIEDLLTVSDTDTLSVTGGTGNVVNVTISDLFDVTSPTTSATTIDGQAATAYSFGNGAAVLVVENDVTVNLTFPVL